MIKVLKQGGWSEACVAESEDDLARLRESVDCDKIRGTQGESLF